MRIRAFLQSRTPPTQCPLADSMPRGNSARRFAGVNLGHDLRPNILRLLRVSHAAIWRHFPKTRHPWLFGRLPRSVSDEITGRGRPWPPGVSPRGESRDVSEVELSSKRDVIWELGTLLTLGAERSAGTDSREHGAILEAYVVMCGDPMLAKKVAFYMRRRRCGDRWKKFVAPVARIRALLT